ncbi:hypothetical protein [Pseudomonas syringae]|uniref:Uncharacterized protein n=1 Tax=Pseudomonas syringae TaxID=317 RepID=A0AB38BZG7_PSESX|nr:hypothetical protein [Pseudomonas syringae]MCK0549692.1 hypothetical protein [Pseudomonas syringae pv. aptata]SFO43281.1 hypothetical protein SAMN05444065_11866 [Pseudomonas syringae]SFO51701.1 hypothetical protein SAMN05444063_10866 [Pseudomonas syringae]
MKMHVNNSRCWLATTHPGQNAKAVACIQVYSVAGKIARPEYCMPLSGSLSLARFHLPAFAEIDNPAD